MPNNTCYDKFLPYSWAKVTIMGVTFNANPFRNIPHFPAHIPVKDHKVSLSCVWHITHVLFQLRPLFYWSLGAFAVSKPAYKDISEWCFWAKIRLWFLYLCHSSAGQHGTWQEPSTLRKYGPCASSAMWVTISFSGLLFPLWNVFCYLF